MKERKLMTVGKNCYVSLFKHHYSVPREHVGKRVVILYDADTVEIYCGLNLVATHDRCDIPYTYSVEEGAQPARSLRTLTTRISRNSSNVRRRLTISFGLPTRSRQTDAVPAKILQQLSGDTVAREEIWNRRTHSGMCMRLAEI